MEEDVFDRGRWLDSFHLRQALEGEYPKLLKIQNDTVNRLNQLQPGFSDIEMRTIEDEVNDDEASSEKQKCVCFPRCNFFNAFFLGLICNSTSASISSRSPTCPFRSRACRIRLT